MLKIESGKRYVTRGGEHGLVISTIVPGAFPILFVPDSGHLYFPKREDGTSISDPVYDLVSEEVVPEPVYWSKPEHVPGPVCWIRNKADKRFSYLVTEIEPRGFVLGIGTEKTSDPTRWDVLHYFEFSTDRVTWRECTVV